MPPPFQGGPPGYPARGPPMVDQYGHPLGPGGNFAPQMYNNGNKGQTYSEIPETPNEEMVEKATPER